MNPKILGPLREFLNMAAIALLCYGIGTDVLWQEITGGIVAAVTIVLGWRANHGWSAVESLIRKVVSAIAGIFVANGMLDPTKAAALVGVTITFLAMVWSFVSKTDDPLT